MPNLLGLILSLALTPATAGSLQRSSSQGSATPPAAPPIFSVETGPQTPVSGGLSLAPMAAPIQPIETAAAASAQESAGAAPASEALAQAGSQIQEIKDGLRLLGDAKEAQSAGEVATGSQDETGRAYVDLNTAEGRRKILGAPLRYVPMPPTKPPPNERRLSGLELRNLLGAPLRYTLPPDANPRIVQDEARQTHVYVNADVLPEEIGPMMDGSGNRPAGPAHAPVDMHADNQ